MNTESEFFIRELTRRLNEQINSVRRELDNLKKLGLLKAKTRNRKKYYHLNKNFILVEELKSIIIKALSSNEKLSKDIENLGSVKVLALSGIFIDQPQAAVDMLIVGDIDREKLANYLNSEVRTQRPVKFAVMSEDDYRYRLRCNDKFVSDIIKNPENQVPINKLK